MRGEKAGARRLPGSREVATKRAGRQAEQNKKPARAGWLGRVGMRRR